MAEEAQRVQRTAYHHGDLRAQLISAVRDLVEQHGPDGFSVAEAARRAGVSSAAPYKHFADRPALLRAVVAEALDRLRVDMEQAVAQHPTGSVAGVAAIGQAYVDFARKRPGVFRLIFALTEGHEDAPELHTKGQACLAVVTGAVARVLGRPMEDPLVQYHAYMLWALVHGHSFLVIDHKTNDSLGALDDSAFVTDACRIVLTQGAPG